jgi:hypothetical protein
MTKDRTQIAPFLIKDCALIAIATGRRAQNLRELGDRLSEISTNSIYYHFWGGLLRPRFDNPEYHNDFAIWVAHSLHNKRFAEKLAVIDPVTFRSLEDLREELVEIIEEHLDEMEFPDWSRRDDQFEFIQHQIVVFKTKKVVESAVDFSRIMPQMSVGSIFYHFIDARRRNENSLDDFQNWLLGFGKEYDTLISAINCIDPYFSPLIELRHALTNAFRSYFQGRSHEQ